MAIWSLIILLVSLGFLAYARSPGMQKYLPRWLWQDAPGGEKDAHANTTGQTEGVSERNVNIDITHSDEDYGETEKTPKASPSAASGAVPSFSLSEAAGEGTKDSATSRASAPTSPAASGLQAASETSPSPRPVQSSQERASSTLMPPPARPSINSRNLAPRQAASLRVPTSGPLPNRGPPVNSQQRVSNSLSPNASAAPSNSRGKILLKPGHSPMDWAALTRSSSAGLSGVSTFQRVTPSQLRQMTGRKGKPAWSSWQGKVYNITPYVDFHPGGGPEIMRCAGRDGEKLFMETHPWVNWENMLGACLVGIMVPEGYHDAKAMGKQVESDLEGLD